MNTSVWFGVAFAVGLTGFAAPGVDKANRVWATYPVAQAQESGQRASTPEFSSLYVASGAERQARLYQYVQRAEYNIQWGPATYRSERGEMFQAPNRAHDLRFYFGPEGLMVLDRTAKDASTLARIKLVSWGREGMLVKAPPATVSKAGQRLIMSRPGLVEWYENTVQGLEQGWTVKHRSQGSGPLVLQLATHPAQARVEDGRVILSSPTGRELHYGKLKVFDARGQELLAHFRPERRGFSIAVADQAAVYPLTIDPLLTGGNASDADATLSTDEIGGELGYSVASAGDVNGDGYADVIVGARTFDGGQAWEGAAFVFFGGTNGPGDSDAQADAQDVLESDQNSAMFGASVSSAGDINGDGYDDVIVGSPWYDHGQSDEGAAFLFMGSSSGLQGRHPADAAATLESNQDHARVATSVSSAGDVNGDGYDGVIVGAHLYHNGERAEGAAFVFYGSASGIGDGTPTSADAMVESNQLGAVLGSSVAPAGDVNGDGYDDVILGSPLYNHGEQFEGAAFVYYGGTSGIGNGSPSNADVILDANQGGATLGWSVASAGDVNNDSYADVIVGAPWYHDGEDAEGAAFVFLGSSSGLAGTDPSSAAATVQSDQANANLGWSVSSAGDVNGDGLTDVIVGAPYYDNGQSDEGIALVLIGSGSGLAGTDPSSAAASIESDAAGTLLGWSVASAGDVNDDPYDDVIVGATRYFNNEGAAFVYLGNGSIVDPSNNAPVANPDSYGGAAGGTLSVSPGNGVLSNDTDGDGDPLTAVLVSGPSHDANFSLDSDGSFIYTPVAAFDGADQFVYQASDGNGGTDQATVTISVNTENDPPLADDQSVSTAEDSSVAFVLDAHDPDGVSLIYDITAGPSNGGLSGTAPNLTYTPDSNFSGADSFVYQVCDSEPLCDQATVSITISAMNEPNCVFDDNYVYIFDTSYGGIKYLEACIGITLNPNVSVVGNAVVEARAGSYVAMGSGFDVEQGAVFSVVIDPQSADINKSRATVPFKPKE